MVFLIINVVFDKIKILEKIMYNNKTILLTKMVIKFTPKFYRIGSLHLRGAGSTLKFLFLIEWSILVLVGESVNVGKCLPCHFLY